MPSLRESGLRAMGAAGLKDCRSSARERDLTVMALPRLASVLSGAHLPRLHPDQPLDVALRQMADWPLLPVVHGADFRRLEGAISLGDILSTYRRVHPRGYDGGAGSATGRTK